MRVMSDPDTVIERLRHHRGPRPGQGYNGHEPWRGIVEETPRLWAVWIKDAWQRQGRSGRPALVIDGRRIEIATVRKTYGEQWYFRCPTCGRRCAFLCLPPGQPVGCYRCCRLGYRSQKARPSSAWAALDAVFSRDGRLRLDMDCPRMPEVEGGETLVRQLRRQLEEAIDGMIKRISIEGDGHGPAHE